MPWPLEANKGRQEPPSLPLASCASNALTWHCNAHTQLVSCICLQVSKQGPLLWLLGTTCGNDNDTSLCDGSDEGSYSTSPSLQQRLKVGSHM